MKLIEKLSGMIEDEIDDAEKYARCALKEKEAHRSLAEVFYTLSTEELRHMSALHGEVVKLIEDYRREHGDPPEHMQLLYDMLHEKHIDHVADVKVMQNTFRES